MEERKKFLDTYNLLKLNHEEMENLNRLTSTEIQSVIKTSQQRKAHDLMVSLVNSEYIFLKNHLYILSVNFLSGIFVDFFFFVHGSFFF